MRRFILSFMCCSFFSAFSQEEKTTPYFSQASQDQFVDLLRKKFLDRTDCGYYLEIGSGHPVDINNTYLFENEYGWKGVSIDIDSVFLEQWHRLRTNPLLTIDAITADYEDILSSFPKVIDYLSLDIDTHYDTVLRKIPFDRHVFKIITIEHDYWRYIDRYRDAERGFLQSQGYYLLCPDVWLHSQAYFEDWWIHPDCFPEEMITALKQLDLKGKKHSDLLDILKTAIP